MFRIDHETLQCISVFLGEPLDISGVVGVGDKDLGKGMAFIFSHKTHSANVTSRSITFNGAFHHSAPSSTSPSNAYLAVHGWVQGTPWIEYYIVENYATFSPLSQPGVTYIGSIGVDGSQYDLGVETYVGTPRAPTNAVGAVTIRRLWSVRVAKRTSGTVTVAAHWIKWATAGPVGTIHEWQIVLCESLNRNGKCNLTVS